MTLNFYLVINSNGTVRTAKKRPALDWNEISISMKLELPNALFQKPSLSAQIVVPDSAAVSKPMEAGVTDNIKQAIEAATGLEVRLTIVEPTAEGQ